MTVNILLEVLCLYSFKNSVQFIHNCARCCESCLLS